MTNLRGERINRVEDERLFKSGGTFVDDLRSPELRDALFVTFVRSSVAHAKVLKVDTSQASEVQGVVAIYTSRDLTTVPPQNGLAGSTSSESAFSEPLLATHKVRYVGEPIAVIITRKRHQGADAAALVQIEYEHLPAVTKTGDAITNSILLFEEAKTNVCDQRMPDQECDQVYADAEIVVQRRIENQRVACLPMECRATAANFDGTSLTIWHSTQNAQRTRATVTDAFGIPSSRVRVVVPDVGGGFGAKIGIDRDSLLVVWASLELKTAVRWTETRTENMIAMTHGRGQSNYARLAGDMNGKIFAYSLDVTQDAGAYPRTRTLATVTCSMAPGVYDIPQVATSFKVVVTNTTPINKYRGAGRPEASAALERMIDIFAQTIGMDPIEVRRRNLIPPHRFPYRTGTGRIYDSGRYEAALNTVLSASNYAHLRARQTAQRKERSSKLLGIGVAVYVDMTGGGTETAKIVLQPDGSVRVMTGSSPQGQGHETSWSMLVASELGVQFDQISVVYGDTRVVPVGTGTYSSRSLQLGGSAIHKAAGEIRRQARQRVAACLDISEVHVTLDTTTGRWVCASAAHGMSNSLTWADVAGLTDDPVISAEVQFESGPTYPFGAHLSFVEVDCLTGETTVLRHVTVDDAGPVLNPVLTEGQRHGGIAQGIAQALFEEVRYDDDGMPATLSLYDAGAVSATVFPDFELESSETPTTLNPLGVKGIGEAATIGALPAVQNAVIDAVAHLGVEHIDVPLSPGRVWDAVSRTGRHFDHC